MTTSAIFEIIKTKGLIQLRSFLTNNMDQINAIDETGQTLLLAAVSNKKPLIASMFLNRFGADINAVNTAGQTAMDIAIENNDSEMIDLLETQIQLNKFIAENNGDKGQALINAVKTGNKKFIPHLIDRDADANARDAEGKTAFMVAVELGEIENALMLLPKAEIEGRDTNGNTAFMIATARMDLEMIAFLLRNKADESAINSDGKTALMTIEDEFKRAEIADFIKEQKLHSSLFSTLSINKAYLEEDPENIKAYLGKDSKNIVTQTYNSQSPTFEGALILAEYYKLKYGIYY